ncbi:MAG TPA: AarF/UbiB family protein [Acidimicrobiales bacterium]|nr:AarF/UbiB family protein [Acidimicrobiales bacterium]
MPGASVAPLRLDRAGPGEAARAVAIGAVLALAVARRLARPAVAWLAGALVARFAPTGRGAVGVPDGPLAWARVGCDGLVDGFERLGPTFVKLGQLVASSPAVFPAPLAAACARCLDQVTPMPADVARRVVEADLGSPVAERFATFDDVPLAAASIAQVHACTLPDGRPAVLKVQRPGIAATMARDLRIMALLARVAGRTALGRTANLTGAVDDLARTTARELDARLEAAEQRRFRSGIWAFGDNAMVTAPEVYEEWCGAHVICMERMHGAPLDRVDVTRVDSELLIRRAVKVWLEALAVHGPFHGDVHAGNLWLLDDGRVAFLDFGIVGELEPEWRALFRDLFRTSALDSDYVRVVRNFKAVGVLPAEADEANLAMVVQSLFAPLTERSLSEVGLGDVLRSLFGVLRSFGVGVPEELLLVTKQLVYFEGYSKSLAPAYVMAKDLFLLRNLLPAEVAARAAAAHLALPA